MAPVFYFLLTLLILDAILLIVVVLLQAGKGGGLAAMGAAGAGSDSSMFGSRQATNLLTQASWWTGGIFLVLAFVLSLLSSGTAAPESILREGFQGGVPVTAPGVPEVFEAPAGEAPATTAPAPGEESAPQGQE